MCSRITWEVLWKLRFRFLRFWISNEFWWPRCCSSGEHTLGGTALVKEPWLYCLSSLSALTGFFCPAYAFSKRLWDLLGFPDGSDGKVCACNAGDLGSIPGLGRCPWRRAWQSTPVFLPGEPHGQRSLAGYKAQGRKEPDTTERLST